MFFTSYVQHTFCLLDTILVRPKSHLLSLGAELSIAISSFLSDAIQLTFRSHVHCFCCSKIIQEFRSDNLDNILLLCSSPLMRQCHFSYHLLNCIFFHPVLLYCFHKILEDLDSLDQFLLKLQVVRISMKLIMNSALSYETFSSYYHTNHLWTVILRFFHLTWPSIARTMK